MRSQAFIFDVDGVLTDTVALHYHAWVRLAEEERSGATKSIIVTEML